MAACDIAWHVGILDHACFLDRQLPGTCAQGPRGEARLASAPRREMNSGRCLRVGVQVDPRITRGEAVSRSRVDLGRDHLSCRGRHRLGLAMRAGTRRARAHRGNGFPLATGPGCSVRITTSSATEKGYEYALSRSKISKPAGKSSRRVDH